MVPLRLLDLGFEIMVGTHIGLGRLVEVLGGEIETFSVHLLIRKYVRRTYYVPGTVLDSEECTNSPNPHTPSHPAQRVPDQVTHRLTKSPGSDRAKCSGVSGSPPRLPLRPAGPMTASPGLPGSRQAEC